MKMFALFSLFFLRSQLCIPGRIWKVIDSYVEKKTTIHDERKLKVYEDGSIERGEWEEIFTEKSNKTIYLNE